MNVPLVRHRFIRDGAFDLRRRVLIKNFLLNRRFNWEPEDNYSETGVQENAEHDDTKHNLDDDAKFQRSKMEGESNNEDINHENDASGDECTIVEIVQSNNSHSCDTVNGLTVCMSDTISQQQLDSMSKNETESNPSSSSQIMTSELDTSPCDPSTSCEIDELYCESTLVNVYAELGKKRKNSGICKKLKRKFSLKKTFTFTDKHSNLPDFNKHEVNNRHSKSHFKRPKIKEKDTVSLRLRLKKMLSLDSNENDKSAALCSSVNSANQTSGLSFRKLFKTKQYPITKAKNERKKSLKRKKNTENDCVLNRSVSIQTDLSCFSSSPHGKNYSYCRENKRLKHNSNHDLLPCENRYWLRSSSCTSPERNVRPLRVLNNKDQYIALEQSPPSKYRFPQHHYWNKDEHSISAKLARSKSVHENKSSRITSVACRRARSVYVPQNQSYSIDHQQIHCPKYCHKEHDLNHGHQMYRSRRIGHQTNTSERLNSYLF